MARNIYPPISCFSYEMGSSFFLVLFFSELMFSFCQQGEDCFSSIVLETLLKCICFWCNILESFSWWKGDKQCIGLVVPAVVTSSSLFLSYYVRPDISAYVYQCVFMFLFDFKLIKFVFFPSPPYILTSHLDSERFSGVQQQGSA